MLTIVKHRFDRKNKTSILYLDGYFNTRPETPKRMLEAIKALKDINLLEILAPHKIGEDHPHVKLRKVFFLEFLKSRRPRTYGRMWFDISKAVSFPKQLNMFVNRTEKNLISTVKRMTEKIEPELKKITDQIEESLKAFERKEKTTLQNIILIGHSQGGMIAEYFSLMQLRPLKGTISLAGIPVLTDIKPVSNKRTPFYLIYGKKDRLIYPCLQKARKMDPRRQETVLKDTSHYIDEAMTKAVMDWLRANIPENH